MVALGPLLGAARKIARARIGTWADGPICSRPELKSRSTGLADYLRWVDELERGAPTTADAVQRLRRLYYSTPLGGARFDRFLDTSYDGNRLLSPLTTVDVRQSLLDGLIRTGRVQTVGPADAVDLSHIITLLDLKLAGLGWDGTVFSWFAVGPNTPESILSWASDLGHAWRDFNQARRTARQKAEDAGQKWEEPLAAAGLATARAWLNDAIAARASLEDIFGDMDGVILARETLAAGAPPAGTAPLTALLSAFYRPVGPPPLQHVTNRFQLFVERADPAIPHTVAAGKVTLTPETRPALRAIVEDAAFWTVLHEWSGGSLFGALTKYFAVKADLASPWGKAMLDELTDRFITLLADGLAGRPPGWPQRIPREVPFAGYPIHPHDPPTVAELEGIAQFYLNWRVPHRPLPADAGVQERIDLRDPSGTGARVIGPGGGGTTVIGLDETADLSRVAGALANADHRDLIQLDAAGGLFRILDVNPAARTLRIIGAPAFAGDSRWAIRQRPRIIVVDPYQPRHEGEDARLVAPSVVELDGAPDFRRINVNFDTIFLNEDLARPSRAYRIVGVDPVLPRVTVAGEPRFDGPSRWLLPSGVSGTVRPPVHNFTIASFGCDHYDGSLFVVYGGAAGGGPWIWTSYTSVRTPNPLFKSSLRGNTHYECVSYRSGGSAFRNFAFKIHDRGAADLVREASFYFDGIAGDRQPVPAPWPPDGEVRNDADGKNEVRFHVGHTANGQPLDAGGSGSAGCAVSMDYYEMRAEIIRLHQQERRDLGLGNDPGLTDLANAITHPVNVALWNAGGPPWTDRLFADVILVRPDERPTQLGP
jgi:hypothetical protein